MAPLNSPARRRLFAGLVSETLSPVVLVAVLLSAAILAPGGGEGRHLLIALIFSAALPYIGLHWAAWSGKTTNHWVSKREQRSKVYAWILASILAGLFLLVLTAAPARLFITFGFFFGSIALAALINRKIKISIHAMAAAALLFALVPYVGPWAWLAAPVTVLVGWSRLALEQHELPEVLLGSGLGLLLGGLYCLMAS